MLLRTLRRISYVLAAAMAGIANFAFAQPVTLITSAAGAKSQICNVFNLMFGILIFVSVIMVLWAAFLYLTAQDDAEQTSRAKKALFYAALGIVAAFLAKGYPLMVAGIFNGASAVQGC